jgi:hypothetical protein
MSMFDIEKLLDAIRWQESRGNPNAVSPAGARGPYQIMDFNTEEAIGGSGKIPIGGATPIPRGMLVDEDRSRQFAREAITGLMKQYSGDVKKALGAYNAGPGNIDKGRIPAETAAYIPAVLNRYDHEVAVAGNTPATLTPERQRFDTLVASKLGSPTDMASDAYASGQLRPDNTGPGYDSSIAQDFTQGRGTAVQGTGQPTNILPPPADTTEEAMAAEEAEASGAGGGNWLSRLIPGDESTKNMGILERMRQPGNREMFLRLGAGIAGGAHKGWGVGLGLGFEGAADALDKQSALDLKRQEFDLENMPKALSVQFLAEKYMKENSLSKSDAMKKAFIDVYATDIRKQGERGLTPFYTREKQPDGTYKVRAWQPTKDGPPEEMNVGENQEFDPGIEFRGLGTKDVGFDRFGNPVVSSPIDNAGKARDQQAGQAWGQAQVDLPKVVSSADALRGYINKVRNDPNLSRMTGALQGRFYNVTGTAGDVQARIDQLKGKGFLQAFQELKGAGAITEKEGEKAEQAFARLANMAVTDEAYVAALDDFNDEIERLVQLAQLKAQGPGAWQGGGATPTPAPAPGGNITIEEVP